MKYVDKTTYAVLGQTAVHGKTCTDQFLFEMEPCGTRLNILCAKTQALLNTITIDSLDEVLKRIQESTGYPHGPEYTPN